MTGKPNPELGAGASSVRRDLVVVLGLLLLSFAAFAVNLRGAFVYDDQNLIAANPLIKDQRQLGTALTSDLAAFKGESAGPRSNYWRPVVVLWLVANYHLFGLHTFGWHVGSLLLHVLVCVLGYRFLLRLGHGWPSAAAAAALFSVHPVHTESVAWVSGSPDLLAAAGLLGALLLCLGPGGARPGWRRCSAIVIGGLAMLAKEIAVVLPLLVAAAVAAGPELEARPARERVRRALLAALPFAAVAALVLVLRVLVLGQLQIRVPWQLSPGELLLTLPSALFFYLRQVVLPLWLGPVYPLRAVHLSAVGLLSFWVPLAGCVVAALGAWLVVRRSSRAWFGAALFLLPLMPALNLGAFTPERLVQDRYLYLPLLGALVLLVEAPAVRRPLPEWATLGVALLLCVPLTAQTVRYGRAWGDEVALWQWGVDRNPSSALTHAQLGHALLAAGRRQEALAELDRALAIRPVNLALLDRAEILLTLGRPDDAERDLQTVLGAYPDNGGAWERLAMVRTARKDLAGAAQALRTGRERAPHLRCSFTSNLAVVLYRAGDRRGAQTELESIRDYALSGREATATCHRALFHLGSLYAELDRPADAAAAFAGFLAVSAEDGEPSSRDLRELSRRQLQSLRSAGSSPAPP